METRRAVAGFIASRRALGRSPATIQLYRWALAVLPRELPASPGSLEKALAALDLAEASRVDVWRIWRAFYGWAHSRLKVPDPTLDLGRPSSSRSLTRFLFRPEIARVLSSCPAGGHRIDATDEQLRNCAYWRDHALVRVALDTGIRLGELAGLTRDSLGDGVLRVSGKTGPRLVRASPQVLELLRGLGQGRLLWLGRRGPLTRSGVELAVRRVLRQAHIRPPKAGPHVLRHTFATWYIAQGGNQFGLQYALGHASIQTTQVYVHLAELVKVGELPHISPLSLMGDGREGKE